MDREVEVDLTIDAFMSVTSDEVDPAQAQERAESPRAALEHGMRKFNVDCQMQNLLGRG